MFPVLYGQGHCFHMDLLTIPYKQGSDCECNPTIQFNGESYRAWSLFIWALLCFTINPTPSVYLTEYPSVVKIRLTFQRAFQPRNKWKSLCAPNLWPDWSTIRSNWLQHVNKGLESGVMRNTNKFRVDFNNCITHVKARHRMALVINGRPTALLCGDLDHRRFTCEIFIYGLQVNVVCCRRFQVSHQIEGHWWWHPDLFYPWRTSAQAVTDYITLNHTASSRYHAPLQQNLACCCKKHMKLYLRMACIGA